MSSIGRLARRELLCIADVQRHIRIGPMLRIEERISPDRDPEIGLGDLAELHPDAALARIRAGVNHSEAYVGGGVGLKKRRCPSAERGGGRVVLKMSISIVVEGAKYP
jgi:hypothetical protein